MGRAQASCGAERARLLVLAFLIMALGYVERLELDVTITD